MKPVVNNDAIKIQFKRKGKDKNMIFVRLWMNIHVLEIVLHYLFKSLNWVSLKKKILIVIKMIAITCLHLQHDFYINCPRGDGFQPCK